MAQKKKTSKKVKVQDNPKVAEPEATVDEVLEEEVENLTDEEVEEVIDPVRPVNAGPVHEHNFPKFLSDDKAEEAEMNKMVTIVNPVFIKINNVQYGPTPRP